MRAGQEALIFSCLLALSLFAPLATTIALGTLSPCEAAEPKRIMMLHSYGPLFKPWSEHAQAVRAEISRQLQDAVDFHDHSLVSARANNDQSEAPFVDYLDALYAEHPLSLIVAIGAPAATFVQRHRQRLFPTTPMILTSVESRRVQDDKLTENDAVVAVATDFRAIFDNILHVLPFTKTVAIVMGTSPNEVFWTEELRRDLAPLAGRLELRWYNKLSFEDILKDAASLPPHSAIFWGLLNVDAAGVVHEASTALNTLSASANAPIFSHNDTFFGEALVGGPMRSIAESSKRAADVAVRILDGERAGDIKTSPTPFASPKFDWRQMQRWGISESNLPAGSEIHFREPSLWEKYRWQSASVVALLLIQAGLIGVLLREKKGRQDAEIEARHRMTELAHVNRSAVAGELSSSIAHELNQPLGSILTNTETAELILKGESPDLKEVNEILADIRRDDLRASEVLRRLRSFVKGTPFEMMDIDLNVLVREVFDFISIQASARKVALHMTAWSEPLWVKGDPIHLQQCVINLIVNSMDAMDAMPSGRTVIGRAEASEGATAVISISDSGPGIPEEQLTRVFDPFYTTKEQGMGIGLSIARTIMSAHHGKIWVENQAGGGASFRLSLPLAAS